MEEEKFDIKKELKEAALTGVHWAKVAVMCGIGFFILIILLTALGIEI